MNRFFLALCGIFLLTGCAPKPKFPPQGFASAEDPSRMYAKGKTARQFVGEIHPKLVAYSDVNALLTQYMSGILGTNLQKFCHGPLTPVQAQTFDVSVSALDSVFVSLLMDQEQLSEYAASVEVRRIALAQMQEIFDREYNACPAEVQTVIVNGYNATLQAMPFVKRYIQQRQMNGITNDLNRRLGLPAS